MSEHFVVLGAARPRAPWFTDVGRWATSASIPAEFVRCVSLDEARARLRGGRSFSALLVDGELPELDRDLFDEARSVGCAPIVVDDGLRRRPWSDLGAAAVLDLPLDPDQLVAALRDHAVPAERLAGSALDLGGDDAPPLGGRLVAVTGAGGTGTSTVAAALAQGLALDPAHGGRVVLVDAALDASQGLLHDTGDVVPGLQELVELHRSGRPSPADVRALAWRTPDRAHDLLLGLRRHRDWTALRPRAVEAAFRSLRSTWSMVVADVDPDIEGEQLTGSLDVEDRNLLARHATATADLVVVTGAPGVVGVHRLVRLLADLLGHGVAPERLLPVVVRAPKSPRRRAELARAVGRLLGELVPGAAVPSPVPIPPRRDLDASQHDGAPVPRAIVGPVAGAARAALGRLPDAAGVPVPVPIRPGELGATAFEEDDQ